MRILVMDIKSQQSDEELVETDHVDVIDDYKTSLDDYPTLSRYTTVVPLPERPVLGREREMRSVLASLNRPEVSNAFLVGDAGSGKTMLVQGVSKRDRDRIYLEVDLAKMASSEHEGEDGALQMGVRIKELFNEAEAYRGHMVEREKEDPKFKSKELVLFMDEFHLIIQLSPAATQSIKPALAQSGVRGIKVIAATTYDEFHEFVSKDQALVQRLQRINIVAPDKDVTISILESIAKRYEVDQLITDPSMYELIVDYSNRYIPANSQPRKSVLILDAMIGWLRAFKRKMDKTLLADVIYESSGVQVTFKVDARSIQKRLNERVLSQKFAVSMIEQRLQIAVADLHDPTKPMSSFLFTGSTGTGKTEMAKGLSELLFSDERALIRFDMSEYGNAESLDRFRSEVTNAVWNRSHSIVLFDETEKADKSVIRLLLQVLDDGRLNDENGRTVSFANTYIILTTNAGSEIYKSIASYLQDDDSEGTSNAGMADYDKVIRASLIADDVFSPELINRVDKIIPFRPLSPKTHERIMKKRLSELVQTVYDKHAVSLTVSKKVPEYLIFEGMDDSTDAGGARGLMSRLTVEVTSAVSRYINLHPNVKHIGVSVEGNMAFKDKEKLRSDARIIVGTVTPRD